jgi:GNAT superfamily N-acetyltransferase
MREYNKVKAQKPVAFETVVDAIADKCRTHIDGYKKLEKKGYSLKLLRRPYNTGFSGAAAEEITKNAEMRMFASMYNFVIGAHPYGDYSETKRDKHGYMQVCDFTVTQLTSCCAAVVFSGAYIHPNIRYMGLGTLLHNWRLYLAEKYGGYSLAVCTIVTNEFTLSSDREYNAQENLLRSAGWKLNKHINNPKSGSDVGLYTRQLNPKLYRYL